MYDGPPIQLPDGRVGYWADLTSDPNLVNRPRGTIFVGTGEVRPDNGQLGVFFQVATTTTTELEQATMPEVLERERIRAEGEAAAIARAQAEASRDIYAENQAFALALAANAGFPAGEGPTMPTFTMPTETGYAGNPIVMGPTGAGGYVAPGIIDAITGGLGGFATGGIGGAIGGALTGLLGSGGNNDPRSGSTGSTGQTFVSCPTGYVQDPSTGQCLKTGVSGVLERTIPGGNTGTLSDVYGQAMMGRYGAALVPAQRASMTFKCPPGTVLGDDNLCYNKRDLRRDERKWRPAAKPLLSAGDAKVLRRAHAVERRLQEVSGRFLAAPKPVRRKKARGRARK